MNYYGFLASILGILLLNQAFPPAARAGMFFDLEAKAVYEDNIVGLLSDKSGGNGTGTVPGTIVSGAMGQHGYGPGDGTGPAITQPVYIGSSSVKNSDTSFAVAATVGGLFPTGKDTSLFLAGAAERISYSTFTGFNMTSGGLTAGVNRMLGDRVLARLAATGMVKRFGDSDRDAGAAGGSFSLREKLSSRFWVGQGYAYERNKADLNFFSYAGNALAVRAGYDLTSATAVVAGCQYLVREYDEPADFKEKANTFTLAFEWEAFRKWFVDLQYDRRAMDSSLPETASTANIFSLALRYSY